METSPNEKCTTHMPRNRPGLSVPTLLVGASKKNTISSTIGTSSR
jgi:hypothetical protein